MDVSKRQPQNALRTPSCRTKRSSLQERICTLHGALALMSSGFAARPRTAARDPATCAARRACKRSQVRSDDRTAQPQRCPAACLPPSLCCAGLTQDSKPHRPDPDARCVALAARRGTERAIGLCRFERDDEGQVRERSCAGRSASSRNR